MRIRYVSNAGIILEAGENRIGVDCFSRDENGIYCDIAPDIKEDVMELIESKELNTLIFTHEHSDHFCPEYVREAFETNREVRIYGNRTTLMKLMACGIPKENLTELFQFQELAFGDMKVQVIQTVHDGEQYAEVDNFSLLINIGRKSVVVTGDANPSKELFEQISKWSTKVDWLLAPFPYVGLLRVRRMMEAVLDIDHIFVLHQPRKEKDAQRWIENTKKVCEQAKDTLPTPLFPERLGEYYFL